MPQLDNAQIAGRLEAFAGLLELSEANPYTARAFRRAADLIRAAPSPVADLVREGRARELRGVGPGIEARLRELVETGEIAELEELERTVSPELVAFGRYLGIGAKRAMEIGQALGIRTPDELREAAREGRLADVPGIGPKTEAKLRAALEGEAEREPRGLLLSRAFALMEVVADAVGGEIAGDVRRWKDEPRRLTVVCAADNPAPVLEAFENTPLVLAIVEREERRVVGVTVEGVGVELVVAERRRFGTELVRTTGSEAYVRALEPLPEAAEEFGIYGALGIAWCPPELREQPFRGEPPRLVELSDLRGDLHCHTTWSDGRASVEQMGRSAIELGYEYLAICDHTPSVGAVTGLDADDVRRQGEEIAAANEALAPFRVLRGTECDIKREGGLDLPDEVLAELDWVTASVHGGQRQTERELWHRVEGAMRNPYVRALSHPTGRLIGRRAPNALRIERLVELALETGTALEVNGLPDRLDLHGEHVRVAVEAGVPIVVNTDAHSVVGLRNMRLALATARRGWATAADVVNTRPLHELLAAKRS